MRLLAEQTYYKVIREVSSIRQQDTEKKRTMYLYDEKIVREYREFSLNDVMDISFKPVGKHGGLLYLHTLKGVFPYIVKTSPTGFVEAYMEVRKG